MQHNAYMNLRYEILQVFRITVDVVRYIYCIRHVIFIEFTAFGQPIRTLSVCIKIKIQNFVYSYVCYKNNGCSGDISEL